MIARLLRNAKIPNGTFEPPSTKSIIVMVESFWEVAYIAFGYCSHQRDKPMSEIN